MRAAVTHIARRLPPRARAGPQLTLLMCRSVFIRLCFTTTNKHKAAAVRERGMCPEAAGGAAATQ